jgi:hypothetical protein
MDTLNRIAQLAYYEWTTNITDNEREEFRRLLKQWKADYDQKQADELAAMSRMIESGEVKCS